jgi:hypothetical protein
MSRREWTSLSATAFAPIIGSGNTHELIRTDWPMWAQSAQQVKRLRRQPRDPAVETTRAR